MPTTASPSWPLPTGVPTAATTRTPTVRPTSLAPTAAGAVAQSGSSSSNGGPDSSIIIIVIIVAVALIVLAVVAIVHKRNKESATTSKVDTSGRPLGGAVAFANPVYADDTPAEESGGYADVHAVNNDDADGFGDGDGGYMDVPASDEASDF